MSNPLNLLLPPPPREGTQYRWGYVTDDTPLQVTLDTETGPIYKPSTLVPLEVGDRVFVLLESRRATVLGKVPDASGPTTLTHSNGWTDFGGGFGGLRARLILPKVVMLSGVIKPGTLAATFATLPVSMRPTSDLLLNVRAWSNDGGVPYRLNVATTGEMSFTGFVNTPSWVSLDGVTFPID